MIYTILNVAFAVFLIWFAYFSDKQAHVDDGNPLMALDIELFCVCIANIITLLASTRAAAASLFFMRVMYVLLAFFSIDFTLYAVRFPAVRLPRALLVVRLAAFLLVIVLVIRYFTGVRISPYIGLNVVSRPLATGALHRYLPFKWFDCYRAVFFYVLPAFGALVMLQRAEASNNRLNFQKSITTALAVITSWVLLALLNAAATQVAMYNTLFPAAFLIMLTLLVYAGTQKVLYDLPFIVGQVARVVLCFCVPAAFVGALFPVLGIMLNGAQFVLVLALVIAIAATASYYAEKIFYRFARIRSFWYAARLEEDLAKLDYNGEPGDIVRAMAGIFSRNIGVGRVRVLVDNGMGELESSYDAEGVARITLDSSNKIFDSLLNQNRTILLRSIAETTHTYAVDRDALLAVFTETQSEAIILLTEGRSILGAILLGAKAGGNVYTDYDAGVFSRLYSYFFVFGYYMKNIANQGVVGTVHREIQMSGQIISSIQENMDVIKNRKVDVGYIMRPAHNIGGEFIDMVKLTADKHIFVVGDLSGKGISASMSMVIVKAIIRTFLEETKDFKLLVEKVNSFIRFNLPKETFFEGVFGLIDFSENTMYYINCGVPALFMYSRSFNNVIEIQGEGRVLGFVKDIGPLIKVKKTNLAPGDIIFICTDGLIDCLSLRGEPFGKNRIQKTIMENLTYPAAKMAEFSYDALVKFISKGLDDDVSVLVMKWLSR